MAVLAALSAAACSRRVPAALYDLPDFKMTQVQAKGEKPFGPADMRGKVWVADFIFTSCAGPCPMLSNHMASLAKTLPPEVRLLSVTVDPDTDSAPVLRDYAKNFGADLERWVFIRGGVKETYQLMFGGFRQPMSVDPSATPGARVTHSTRFLLVDKRGGVRGLYDGLSASDDAAIARDAGSLLKEEIEK